MKKHLTLCLAFAAALVLAMAPAAKADHVFIMWLDGFQEVPEPPAGFSSATGYGVVIMSDDASRVDWAFSYSGMLGTSVSGAHFHLAPMGEAGNVVRGYPNSMFTLPEGHVSGMWTGGDAMPLSEAAINAFFENNIYFNLHTMPGYGGGELRGQVFYFFSY